MRLWGITGTNGKTTTTWIAARFMKASYITTVEVDTLKRKFSTGYTTPPLKMLDEIFAEMQSAGAKDCVMEVSSHAIHQRRTGDYKFSGGAFTNLSEDHLDYHKTMEEYFRVKASFARQIAEESPGAPYVVSMDGGCAREMLEFCRSLPNLNVIPVSIKDTKYDLSALKLVGDYNKSNVLVAAALAEAAGIEHDIIQKEIPLLEPRWGRLERVATRSKGEVYVDFAHTPDGLEKVLSTMRENCRGRLFVVFGAGGDRDRMKRPLMGEACEKFADELIVTSDNPRSENPIDIIGDILKGIKTKTPCVEPDRKKAIHLALESAEEGDVIVICGKGHETTQEIAGVKYPFDDREVARNF